MAGFTGFTPEAAGFLRDLAANNSREWFTAHKPDYERFVLSPFRLFLADLITALTAADIKLAGDPAKAIFRIHRDVRFSNDKRPYKTNAGAVLGRECGKVHSGVLYTHIDPQGSFFAAGFWTPEREALDALREAIYVDPDRFAAIQADLAAAGLGIAESESLSRMPRGYEDAADRPSAAILRMKSFMVRQPIALERLGEPGLIDDAVAFAAHAYPLLNFGWNALTVLDPTRLKR